MQAKHGIVLCAKDHTNTSRTTLKRYKYNVLCIVYHVYCTVHIYHRREVLSTKPESRSEDEQTMNPFGVGARQALRGAVVTINWWLTILPARGAGYPVAFKIQIPFQRKAFGVRARASQALPE